jgi:ribokinase
MRPAAIDATGGDQRDRRRRPTRPARHVISDNRPVASGRVLVVGSVNVDLVVAAPRLPGPGQTVTGGDLARYQGGKGGNQATAAARLGARVAFVGSVGDDEMGRQARSALASEGIEVAGLALSTRATGVALIVVDPRGENLITVAPGANGEVHAAHVRTALAALAPGLDDVVLVCREIPPDGVRAALEVGREAGSITILNPAPADGLGAATLALADILTPNETELALLVSPGPGPGPSFGRGDPETAARHVMAGQPMGRAAHDRAVVVTLGAAGALIVRAAGAAVAVPAPAVEVVDTTGAGDTFNGALAAGLADGLDLARAVRRAVAAAALSTTRPGARSGIPTRAELEAFLGKG